MLFVSSSHRFARRMLLLTATPFQLNPQETVSILNVIDHMETAIGKDRVAALQQMRERLARCMESSERAGRAFSREWGVLADQLARWDSLLSDVGVVPRTEIDPRTERVHEVWTKLSGNGNLPGSLNLDQVSGPIRPFFSRAMDLRQANQALSQSMRPLVIRHRRSSVHRRYWVGREYPPKRNSLLRPDHSRLHLAPGQSLEPRDELVQYLLMKVVAALSRGRYRTTLGTALTGCYSTMWKSKEGQDAIDAAARGGQTGLMDLLNRLTGKAARARDAEHPKLRASRRCAVWSDGIVGRNRWSSVSECPPPKLFTQHCRITSRTASIRSGWRCSRRAAPRSRPRKTATRQCSSLDAH